MRRWPPPRTRSTAVPRRPRVWRRWDWPPGRRTRCRGTRAAARRVRRRRPSRAPSTGKRRRWPPPPEPRWRPPPPAVPAWPPRGLALRSAGRRAATPRECPRAGSQHLLGTQFFELLGGLAQQPDVDVVVVLSRTRGTGITDGARRFGEHRHDARSQHVALDGIVIVFDQHAAGPQLRVVDHLGDGVDRSRDNACGAEGFDDRAGLALGGPRADDLVEFVLVAAAGAVGGEPLVGGQFGTSH